MYKNLFIILFMVLIAACSYQQRISKEIKRDYPFRINGQIKSNLPFKVNGYYWYWYKQFAKNQFEGPNENPVVKDSIMSVYFFYSDGTYCKYLHNHYLMSVDSLISEVLRSIENKKTHWIYNNANWGSYVLAGDTIKTVGIHRESKMSGFPTHLFGELFLIDNNNSLKIIGYSNLINYNGQELMYNRPVSQIKILPDYRQSKLNFVENKNILPSNSWLKYQHWFWTSEQDFLKWKDLNKNK